MTWLDFGVLRSRSQQAVEVAKAAMSTLGCGSPSFGLQYLCHVFYCARFIIYLLFIKYSHGSLHILIIDRETLFKKQKRDNYFLWCIR